MDMELSELGDHAVCIRLTGRLDASGAERIETRFTAAVVADGRHALVDLSGLSFLASMGIRLLISNARALNRKGRQFVLFGATGMVQGVLDLAALDQIMPIVADEAQALELIAA